jgi:hypothetical protein
MKIDIERISEVQRDDEFWKQHAAFQRHCDKMKKDVRAKFIQSFHEANHMVYLRRGGWTIKLHGPFMYYENGELRTASGAVEQVEGGTPLKDWQIAKKSVAGFVSVETLVGQPNEQIAIDGDIRVLSRESKATGERLDELVRMAKTLVRCELNDPAFVKELEVATREYEMEIFHTDETWSWAVKEFRLDLPGERYAVALPSLGAHGLLLDGDDLKLFVDGKEVAPHDQINYCDAAVLLTKPERKGAADVIRRWNDAVRAATERRIVQTSPKPKLTAAAALRAKRLGWMQ